MILHSRPSITAEDLEAVREACASEMLAQGSLVEELECAMSEWAGGVAGVATASGTAALTLALAAVGVEAGSEVVLPSYICHAVRDAVTSVGAVVVLSDVGGEWVITPEAVERVVTAKTRAIVVPHACGLFADVSGFRRFGVPLVEDCAQAVAGCRERPITGDVATFSFHPTKCLTTGEGGMAVSRDPDLVARIRVLRDGSGPGAGARLSNLGAALGLSQLRRYEGALERRRTLAAGYESKLGGLVETSFRTSRPTMHFRYLVRSPGGIDRWAREFAARGITVRHGLDELLHRAAGLDDESFRSSVSLFESTVSLPIYPALTDEEHARCIEAAVEIFGRVDSTATGSGGDPRREKPPGLET